MLNASDFLLVDFLNDFYVTLAQTAPFSDLPVAERRGKMDKKRMRVEMEKTEEMEVKAWEVVLEKVPWVPPPSLKIKFKIVIQLSETVQITYNYAAYPTNPSLCNNRLLCKPLLFYFIFN